MCLNLKTKTLAVKTINPPSVKTNALLLAQKLKFTVSRILTLSILCHSISFKILGRSFCAFEVPQSIYEDEMNSYIPTDDINNKHENCTKLPRTNA